MHTAQQIVAQLYERGMTDQAIADAVLSKQPTICRLRNGVQKDCTANLYIRLAKLYQKVSTKGKAKEKATRC